MNRVRGVGVCSPTSSLVLDYTQCISADLSVEISVSID